MLVFLKKHINLFCYMLTAIILIIYMRLWLSVDEYFSLDLIHHGYKSLIYIDSYDIHPPLYYIVLKLFLTILLPVKHGLIIEIIFSRIFSIICSLISVVYLIKINKYFGINIGKGIQIFLFFIIPNVLFIDNMNFSPSNNIRMYSLAALFVILTWYYILRFNKTHSVFHAILFIIFAELAAYTHYYAAVIAGLFILLYFMYFVLKKNFKMAVTYFISGTLFLMMYVPWIIYGIIRQFSNLNYSAANSKYLIELVIALIIIIIFIIPIIRLCNNEMRVKNNDLMILIIDNLLVIGFTGLYSFIKNPIFLVRYVYPSMIILEFIALCYVFSQYKRVKKVSIYYRLIELSLVFIMPAVSAVSLLHETFKVIPISANIYRNDIIFGNSYGNRVDISNPKYMVKDFDFNNSMVNIDTQYAFYLKSINKTGYLRNKNRIKYDENNKSYPSYRFKPKIIDYFK